MEVLKLAHPFATPQRIVLPRRDAFGVLHGELYRPILNAVDMKSSTRATFGSVKFRRMHEALSIYQLRALLAFNFNPYVVDIREHYPVYEQESYNQARLLGENMQTSDLVTCNIILTLVLPPDNRLHYHCIRISSSGDKPDPSTARPPNREERVILSRGWTREILDGTLFSRRAFGNHAIMRSWIVTGDIWKHHAQAHSFAQRLLKRSLSGTFGDVIERHARHLGVPSYWTCQLFVFAVALGLLYLDHNYELRVDKPLHLESFAS